MNNDTLYNILFCGIGGQGVLKASEICGLAALADGYHVKKSEVHGMAQRGGSVVSHVRYGREVFSPVIEEQCADFLLAFEKMEALRWLHFLKPGGTAIVNKLELLPSGLDNYPAGLEKEIEERCERAIFVEAEKLAREAGSPRAVNVVLLGVLAGLIGQPVEKWQETIRASVKPKTIDINLKAFDLGHALA